MTRFYYHSHLKKLHPDLNGGDHSQVEELVQLQENWKRRNTLCACGCRRVLTSSQFDNGFKFATHHCQVLALAKSRRKPARLVASTTPL